MIKKVLFAGNNQIAVDILKFIKKQDVKLVGLLVHPYKGSKKRSKLISLSGLPKSKIYNGEVLNRSETINKISQLKPDLILSINFRYIFGKELIKLPRFGCVNLHFGYLPYNKGVYADVWSIIDETPAGVTYHLVDQGIDTGAIIAQKKVNKLPTDTGKALYKRLTQAAENLFRETWPQMANWKLALKKQKNKGKTHKRTDIIKVDQIELDKKYKAKDLINILRARTFPPYRGAYFISKGKKVYIRVELTEAKR